MAKYGLIGKSLRHSQSKLLHSFLGDYEYDIIEVDSPEKIEAVLNDTSYDGFNVTIPYKEAVIRYLDELSDRAESTRAVNCVRRMPDGRLKGFNTDVYGFKTMIGDHAEGRPCMILGTGGAARAVALALEEAKAESVVMVSRNPEAARERLGDRYKIIGYEAIPHYYETRVIINATPVGQLPDNNLSPLNENHTNMAALPDLRYAVDLIYNPYRTKFLQDAKRITGCKTMSGIEMLILQAIDSRNIWLGRRHFRIEQKVMVKDIKRKLLQKQLNVVVIGMPGSGKTTIFRRYAFENNRRFIDVDEKTEEIMGEKIPAVLSADGRGEEYFRSREFEAVKEVCHETGSVIATGGGTILNPLSRDLLRSNGVVVYLRRPTDSLSVKNRPLSQKIGVTELFNRRDRIYRKMADFTLMNSKTFGADAEGEDNAREYNKDMKKFTVYIGKKIDKYISELAENKWI